jgi:chorismate dehydratase
MQPIRIGVVRYLNTAPLNFGLEKLRGLELVPSVPAGIAEMIQSGTVDLGLASVIDAARSRTSGVPLTLVPAGMIGCDGPTLTVRLFSKVPLDKVSVIHADIDSHTSVVLCQVVMNSRTGATPRVVPLDTSGNGDAAHSHEAVLLIGDKVVVRAPSEREYPHQLDLGEAWKQMTGLPFVYAMWMCRSADAGSAQVATAAALLDRQLLHNLTRLDSIVGVRAAEHGWPRELAVKYLGELLRYRVGDAERAAVARFLAEAFKLGLIPSNSVSWIDDPAS